MNSNTKMLAPLSLAGLALLAGLATAQPLTAAQKAALDKAASDYMKANKVRGLSLVVGSGNVIQYSKGFGLAKLMPPKMANGDTVFRLASVSKPVTAIAAMTMVQEGKFDPAKKTRQYFPQLPAHHTHTVAQILSHMSGIRHYKNPEPAAAMNIPWPTMKAASGLIMGDPLLFAPGKEYSYSTHAFTLLGGAMETAGGTTFKNLIQQRIGARFGVPTIRVEQRSVANPNRSDLFQVADGVIKPVPADNTNWKAPGGGLEASGNDLCRLGMRVLLGIGLNAATLDKMLTKQKFNDGSEGGYGLGFRVGSHAGKRVASHSGEQTGSQTHWRLYPQSKLVVVVLSNTRGHDPDTLARQAAEIAGP